MEYEFNENKKQVDFFDKENQVSVKFYENGDIVIKSFPNVVCLTKAQIEIVKAIYDKEA